MASKKILTDLNIDGALQVTGPAAGAGSILISDKDVGETSSLSLNMTKSGTGSFVFDGQASSSLNLGSGSVPNLMTLDGDGGTVNTSGEIGLNEDKKVIFDANGDSFASIHVDTSDSSNTIYNGVSQHHFKNGDDGAFETVKAGSFIKDGGTSSQFLKANGSVDSNTYLTSSSTQSKYLRSDTADTTTGTLTAPKFFVSAVTSSSQWAFQARNNSSTADSGLYFNGGSSEMYLRKSDNNIGARIRSNGASYFKGGNVGIGIDATEKLHISGETHPSIKVQSGQDASYNFEQKVNYGDEAYQLTVGGYKVMTTEGYNTPEETYIYANNSKALSFASTGAATFSNTVTGTNFILSSDSRLKNNVEEVDNKSIDVDWKTFEMKSNKGQKRYGVIAQELEEVHPEFVRTDDEGMKSVAYVDLLIAKIAELEARLEKLEK